MAVNYISQFVSALLTVAFASFMLVATQIFTEYTANKQLSSLSIGTTRTR
jgi:hypothetical protein